MTPQVIQADNVAHTSKFMLLLWRKWQLCQCSNIKGPDCVFPGRKHNTTLEFSIRSLLLTKSLIDKPTQSGQNFSPQNCASNCSIRWAWTFSNCWNMRTPPPQQRQQPRVCQLLSLPPERWCVRVQGQECVAPTGGPHGLLEWTFSSQFHKARKKGSVWTRRPQRNLYCAAAPSRQQLTAAEMAATHNVGLSKERVRLQLTAYALVPFTFGL